MSLTFVLPGAALPDSPALEAALPRGAELDLGAARAGVLGRVKVPGASTRGVGVRWDNVSGMVLELLPLSSEADVAVAVAMAVHFAHAQWLPIKAAGRTFTADSFQDSWTLERQRRHVLQDERSMRDLANDSRIRVDGIIRSVVIGPRVIRGLPDTKGVLVEWLRQAQWLEGAEPLALPAEPLGGDPAGPRMVTVEPGARVLLAPADLVILPGEPTLYLPHSAVLEVFGSHARRLDECQILIDVLPPGECEHVRSRARAVAVDDPTRWERAPAARGVVLPELRPPTWTAIDGAVVWSIQPDRAEGLPLVALVEERSRSRTTVAWADLGTDDPQTVQAKAIQDLEERLPGWEPMRTPDGKIKALSLYDAYASEALLSREMLREAHRLLGAQVLLAAVPVRGVLMVERAEPIGPDDPTDPARLLAWAQATWQDATHGGVATPLTPHLLLIMDGAVVGRANDAGPSLNDADAGSIDMPGLFLPEPTDDVPRPSSFRGDNRAILLLAVPALGSLAVEPLVALVDTAFVASLGDAAVGALGVAGAILSLAFVVFNFLAYGTTPLVAEARARGDRAEAGRTIVAALTLAVGIGLIGTMVVYLGASAFVALMGASGEVFEAAVTYLSIRAVGAPALLLIIAGHGAYRGFQDTATPLLLSLAVAALNVGLDALFLLGWGWGVAGAAWASVIAQWLGAIGFLVLLLGPHGYSRGVPRRLPRLRDLLRLLGVGSVLSVRTLAVVGVMALAASVATRLGETSIAAHQVVHQLWMAAAMLADGLAVAAQALVASAPTPDAQRDVVRRLLVWGFFTGLGLSVLLLAAQLALPVFFQVSEETLALAGDVALIAAAVQPLAALVFLGDGLYLGARRFGFAAWTMVVAAVVGALGLWFLPPMFGLAGVWFALALFVAARLMLLVLGAFAGWTEGDAQPGGAGSTVPDA